jgi:drug/metabolite transporter (DMT)-like permease
MSFLIFPFIAGFLYVLAALWLKRAGQDGADLWLIAFSCNAIAALAFIGLGVIAKDTVAPGPWWQPALAGACFVGGQTMALASFRYGDVSIATPVLGLKIIMVAVFSIIVLNDYGSPAIWAGAILATIAVGLVGKSDKGTAKRVWFTVLLAAGGAAGYASFDVFLQRWAAGWGVQTFLGWSFVWVIVWSLPFLGARLKGGTFGKGKRFLWTGAGLMAVQSMLVALVIGHYGHATAVNVVYSGRGVWSVLAVWLLGTWFANNEASVGRRIMTYRVVGSVAMVIAMVLVVI